MRSKEVKQLVNEAFQNETPNLLFSIKNKCQCLPQVENEKVINKKKKDINLNILFKRFALCSLVIVMFLVGFLVGNIDKGPVVNAKEASIYLDVNPSVEIQIDDNSFVLECIAINKDGEKILNDISLKGVNLNTALYAIVGSMYANRYLNVDTNSILVSVDSKNENNLLVDITNQINNFFKENEEMNCSIIAQNIVKNEELENKALQYQSSIGKMNLIEKIVKNSDYFTEDNLEELVEMNIHELDLLYQGNSNSHQENEHISGTPSGYIENDEEYDYIIEVLDIDDENVKDYDIATLYHYEGKDSHKMIYVVSLTFKDQEITQNYIIDCKNGELLSEDVIDKWKDKLGKDKEHNGNDNREDDKDQNHSHKKN